MIRYFLELDFKSIYNLGNKINSHFSQTNDLNEIYKDQYTKVLVYEKNQEIIGFLMYVELEESVDILNVLVKEKYRRQKIASCLIDYMISELQDSVKLITLEVRKSNKAAINLYEKFGFEIINIRQKYYGNEDAYLMGRIIKE